MTHKPDGVVWRFDAGRVTGAEHVSAQTALKEEQCELKKVLEKQDL